MPIRHPFAQRRGSVMVAALVLTAVVGCSAQTLESTRVQMLWFGTTANGAPTYGVTAVNVDARRNAATQPFAVDMSAAASAGDAWQTAAWTAATVGAMLAGADPRGLTVSYRLTRSIDGPSAGGVLATAVLADLGRVPDLSGAVTMTGTVLPSGGVGPVGGIPAKLRAAAENGINTVLVPQGQNIVNDPVTGQRVAVSGLADELGIRVLQVASVHDALGYFTSPVTASAPSAGDASTPASPGNAATATDTDAAPELSGFFADSARATLPRLVEQTVEAPPASSTAADRQSLDAERQRIATGVAVAASRTAELIEAGRAIDAFARVTLAQREVLAWNARARTYTEAAQNPNATTARLAAEAWALAQTADLATTAADQRVSLQYIEQAAALPDVLSWATDSWAVATMVGTSLRNDTALAPADLAAYAAALASARYDLDIYLPFSAQVADRIGQVRLADPKETTDMLAAYAHLLADTGDAVTTDARRATSQATPASTQLLNDPLSWEFSALTALGERWEQQEPVVESAASPADVAPALSTAMSYYVAATTWAATSQLAGVSGSNRSFSPSDWTTQVDVATTESRDSAATAENRGLDPDYLAWNESFGRSVATAAEVIGANDAIRLNGLQVQWYGNVQGHMLLALGAEASSATAADASR